MTDRIYEGGFGRIKRPISVCFVMLGLIGLIPAARAAVDWPVIGFAQVVTNTFSHPTYITHAGDGTQRIFVSEQLGRIRIIQSNGLLSQPFLDITNRVRSTAAEQGLLGMAFPAGFATNGHFYVDYTRSPDGAVVISRFQVSSNANVADTNSEQVVKVISKPFNNHNGGQLAFGPDGYLYLGVGDGGSEGDPLLNGQKTTTLLGKLLRIDVESGATPYGVPADNPFVGNTNYLPEIWALGLRNPWRFSFDRLTGDLYIADVGQNRYEEVDFQPAGSAGGQNYGWRIMEGATNYQVPAGFTNFPSLTLPVSWYDHFGLPSDGGASVTGGYVYRGPSEPRMDGLYFYGDFIVGWMWGLKRDGTNWQSLALLSPGLGPFHYSFSTFGEDESGRIYMADYGVGKIYQLQDTHQTWAPVFSPPGSFASSNAVLITCPTTNAIIHYTTNGVDPVETDPIVPASGLIQINNGGTNKAKAFRADLTPSSVTTAVYTFRVGTPLFSPPAGPIPSNTVVSITTATPGATLYYTTNGTTPTTSSAVYTTPLTLTGPITLRALGVAGGYSNSAVASVSFPAAQVATPVFAPSSGPITNGTTIAISCSTTGAVVYFTLDGSTPTVTSAIYTNPFVINGGTTVKAVGMFSNYLNSAVQSVFFSLVQTATPVFTPSSGPITNGTSISISCATPGSTIYYTTDGGTPTTNSPVYTGLVVINGGTTVNAFAVSDQHLDSAVRSTFFSLVQTATPTFTPATGPVTFGTQISILCTDANSIIYFTTDGTTPTTNSAVYSVPLVITQDTTVSAFATAPEHLDSAVRTVTYALVKAATPVFNPAQGPLTNGSQIAMSCATSNAIIRYTLDGSDPSTNSPIYVTPLTPAFPCTIEARAYRSEMNPSDPQAVYYGLVDWVNTVVTTVAGGSGAGFSNGPSFFAQFANPQGVCLDSAGNLYVADSDNNVIRQIQPGGQVSTFAGTGVAGSKFGPANTAQFTGPTGVAVDNAGAVYVADGNASNLVCKISNATVSLLAVTHIFGNFDGMWQLTVDNYGNVYAGCWGHVVKILPNGDVLATPGGVDSATCYMGWCPGVSPAVDAATNIYAGTAAMIWRIAPSGAVDAYAGSGGGFTDGPRLNALFDGPQGVFLDYQTNLLVAEYARIRRITPSGIVSTLAGTGVIGYQNGPGRMAQFSGARGLCADTNGNIYVADSGNNCIRKISPDTGGIGIADDWQIAHFGHVGIDPNDDPDHDGMSNFAEFWAGTDPLDADSSLTIDKTSFITNGHMQIRWQTVAGKSYIVQYSADLQTWNNLGSVVAGDGTMALVIDPSVISQSNQRYYRVRLTGF